MEKVGFGLPVRANATGRGLSSSRERQGSRPKRATRYVRAALPRLSSTQIVKKETGMAPTAAYLIALALTLLILVILWEGLS